MKSTFVLAFLAAVALQALGAPTLKEGVAPLDSASEAAVTTAEAAVAATEENEREKKSNYYPGGASIGYGVGGLTPCAASGGHISGSYGASGISLGHGASGFNLGHGSLVGPGIHSGGVGIGGFGAGYGLRPTFSYGGFGGQHYREDEANHEQDMIQQTSENQEQMERLAQQQMQQQDILSAGEANSERSAYGGGYGGGYGSGLGLGGDYGSGLVVGGGSGLALGGGAISNGLRPLGGPAVAVFPGGGLGGCGAIPLMMSCSPNLVQGYLQHMHVHGGAGGYGYGAGGYGYGGGAVIAGGHGIYRDDGASLQANQNGEKMDHQSQHKQGASHASSVTKTSSSSHRFQQKSSSSKSGLVA